MKNLQVGDILENSKYGRWKIIGMNLKYNSWIVVSDSKSKTPGSINFGDPNYILATKKIKQINLP